MIILFHIVGDVKLNLGGMMKQKEEAVKQLTSGIAYLFKNNKVILLSVNLLYHTLVILGDSCYWFWSYFIS